jgi:hypothetical protein
MKLRPIVKSAYVKVPDAFPVQIFLNRGDALSPLLFDFVFRICHQESPSPNHDVSKLNGTHQLLVCAFDVNILDENINSIKRRTSCNEASKFRLV